MKLSITADATGVQKMLRSFEQLAQGELRRLATNTGRAVRDRAKSLAPVAQEAHRKGFRPGTYRDSIVAEDRADGTYVFADLPPVLEDLDLHLEFGTSKARAIPHMLPAAEAEQEKFRTSVAAVLQKVADEVSG